MKDIAPFTEVLIVYACVTGLTILITRLEAVPVVGEHVHFLVAALFFVTAYRLAQREDNGLARYGIELGGLLSPADDEKNPGPLGLFDLGRTIRRELPSALRETAVAFGVAAVIFPPFALGFYIYHTPTHEFRGVVPPDLASFALAQLVVVGPPEEALFRGYFQTRLHDAIPRTVRILGASLSPLAWIGQAVLFAAIHFAVDLHAESLAVFFPGLVFGWLRALRGGIGAAVVFHALSNIYADVLFENWLR